jgi:HK97 family phage major capsid protein
MRLLKSTTGSYIFMGTASTGPDDESRLENPMRVWEVPTVISPSMPAGSFLVGSFQFATVLFVREAMSVQIAFQNEGDFIRNLVTLRGELRSGLAVPLPAGLLKGTLPAGTPGNAQQPAAAREEMKSPAAPHGCQRACR